MLKYPSRSVTQFFLHQVLDVLIDFSLVLIEDMTYVRWSARCRTFEVSDLWDWFVVCGFVVEDYLSAEGLVLDLLFEGVCHIAAERSL